MAMLFWNVRLRISFGIVFEQPNKAWDMHMGYGKREEQRYVQLKEGDVK